MFFYNKLGFPAKKKNIISKKKLWENFVTKKEIIQKKHENFAKKHGRFERFFLEIGWVKASWI